jgi:methylated-DNA-[protein]-cysteine S-methyltransferase
MGLLELAAEPGGALVYLGFNRPGHRSRLPRYVAEGAGLSADRALLEPARRQLEAYFRGELRDFDLPLAPRGTPFQLRVWAELRNIPYGRTISYGELSRRLGDPALTRAVGAANGANPISIIIPCHRVIGADGALVGYGGGLDVKRKLLDLEAPARMVGLFGE